MDLWWSVVCTHTSLVQMRRVLLAQGTLGGASSASLNSCLAKLEGALPSCQSHCGALSWHFVPAPQSLFFPPLLHTRFLPSKFCDVRDKDSYAVGLQQLGCQDFCKEMKGNGWFSLLMVSVTHNWDRKPSAILAYTGFICCESSAWEHLSFQHTLLVLYPWTYWRLWLVLERAVSLKTD